MTRSISRIPLLCGGGPHAWLAHLRRHDPVHWQDEPGGPGFWVVTKYEDCVAVNREYDRFSSAARGTMPLSSARKGSPSRA